MRTIHNGVRLSKGCQNFYMYTTKVGFIDDTMQQTKIETIKLKDRWMVQSMLVSRIMNAIKPTLRSIICYKENAKERFSIVNEPRI